MAKLDTQINIKVSKEEKDKIWAKAKDAGLSASAYMKLMSLKGEVSIIQPKGK